MKPDEPSNSPKFGQHCTKIYQRRYFRLSGEFEKFFDVSMRISPQKAYLRTISIVFHRVQKSYYSNFQKVYKLYLKKRSSSNFRINWSQSEVFWKQTAENFSTNGCISCFVFERFEPPDPRKL